MKKFFGFIVGFVVLTAVCTLSAVAFGADAATTTAVTVAAAPAAAASTGTFDAILAWFGSHQGALGLLIAAVIDFIFSINPNWASNSALHFVYLIAQKMGTNVTAATPPAIPPTV